MLPILHLNGYKIANPTVLARIPHDELESLLRGYGYRVYTVEGDDPKLVHQQLAATMDAVIGEIRAIQRRAREDGDLTRPAWPIIVLRRRRAGPGRRSWTGCRSRGPGGRTRSRSPRRATTRSTWRSSRSGCARTGAEELFDADGALVPELAALAPRGERRMSANPHANGGPAAA